MSTQAELFALIGPVAAAVRELMSLSVLTRDENGSDTNGYH